MRSAVIAIVALGLMACSRSDNGIAREPAKADVERDSAPNADSVSQRT
jgi:hypothetical protein